MTKPLKITPEADRILRKRGLVEPRKFTNPYPITTSERVFSGAERNAYRISVYVPNDVYDFFKGIRPANGTLTNTLLLMLRALKEECERQKINDYTQQDEFERLVANCKISEEKL